MPAALFPTCVLPGCGNLTSEQGAPCAHCLSQFGSWLQAVPGTPLTADEQDARDTQTQAQYALQRTAPAGGVQAGGHAAQRKANQLCWLCEQRRTCTQQPHGWECDHCRAVT